MRFSLVMDTLENYMFNFPTIYSNIPPQILITAKRKQEQQFDSLFEQRDNFSFGWRNGVVSDWLTVPCQFPQ